MGAAIILQHAAIDKRVFFCVSDCSFSSLHELLKIRLKEDYHLPPFPMMNITDFFIALRTGMSLKKVSPIRDIAALDTPVFFVHGKNDSYIPPSMSEELYRAKKGAKKLYIAPNARHVESYWKNRDEYERLVGEFLDGIGL